MMLVNPNDLPPCHRKLLEEDFWRLSKGSAAYRIQWLEQMDSALSARLHLRRQAQNTTTPTEISPLRGLSPNKQSNLSKTDHID